MFSTRHTLSVNIDETHGEPDLAELLRVEDKTSVKDERGLGHLVVDDLPVDLLELLPLGRDDDRLGLLRCLDRGGSESDRLLDCETVSVL